MSVTVNIPRYSDEIVPRLEPRSRVIVDAELQERSDNGVMTEFTGQLHVHAFEDGHERQFEVG